MKHAVSVILVAALGVLAGCSTCRTYAYRSHATFTPALAPGQYDVAFVIEDVSNPAHPKLLWAPRLRVLKGKEASVSVGEEPHGLGIVCTALVQDVGKLEGRHTTRITTDAMVWELTLTEPLPK